MSPANPNLTPNAPVTGWRVTSQTPTMGLDAAGQGVQGYKVSFTTGSGVQGSIFIPQKDYTPDNVKAAIANHAAQIDAVSGLTG